MADAACMSFLWLFCSLPLFTVGASTCAFYEFCMHQVSDTEGSVWKSFFDSFKKHFKKATLIWLIQLAGTAFLAWDLWACWQYFAINGSVIGLMLGSFCLGMTLIFLSVFFYIYPILAVFDFPLKKLFADSLVMAMGNLHVTITLIVLAGLAAVAFYYVSLLFFFWFGLYVFFSSYFITGVFLRYTEGAEQRPGLLDRLRGRRK